MADRHTDIIRCFLTLGWTNKDMNTHMRGTNRTDIEPKLGNIKPAGSNTSVP
jgi:hypothetical protein